MRRGAEGVWDSRNMVRAFSSCEVGGLGGGGGGGGGIVVVPVGFEGAVLGSSGIWTLILRMSSSSSVLS